MISTVMGSNALLEYALGTSDNDATQSGPPSASRIIIDGILYDSFTYTVKEVADDVRTSVETTTDLQNWSNNPDDFVDLIVTSQWRRNGDSNHPLGETCPSGWQAFLPCKSRVTLERFLSEAS
jgi:hypothetical protein